MTTRVVVWAAVSSRPQFEKDSVEQQVADATDLAERRGWGVVETLVVPGESRSYIDLADAISGLDQHLRPGEPNAYRQLLGLLEKQGFDILLCRGRDRLGRTDALASGIEERCRRSGVVLYSMAMPPAGTETGDLWGSAVERARAQTELVELRRRHSAGMDGRAKRGQLLAPLIPFGYREDWVQGRSGPRRTAAVESAEAAAYRDVVKRALAKDEPMLRTMDRLRVQFSDRTWSVAGLGYMLRNPFYAGLIVRRRRRQKETALLQVIEPPPGESSLFDDPARQEAEDVLLRRAQEDKNHDKFGRPRLFIVAQGEHEPLIDLADWVVLQREMDSRRTSRRPSMGLFAYLVKCARRGKTFKHRGRTRDKQYSYCACRGRPLRQGGCDNPPVRTDLVVEQLGEYLQEMYDNLGRKIEREPTREQKDSRQLDDLLAQRDGLLDQRDRLETLFTTGRIDLDSFDRRAAEIGQGLSATEDRIRVEQEVLASRERMTVRREALGAMLDNLAERLLEADSVAANQWLREMIDAIVLDDRRIKEVRLRV